MHGQLLRIDEAAILLGDKTGDRSAFSAWVEDETDLAGDDQLIDEIGDALEDVFVDALNAEDANDYFAQVQRGIRSAVNNSPPSGVSENLLRRFAGLLRRYRLQRFDEMQAAEDLVNQFSQEDTDEAASLLGGLLARVLARPPAPARRSARPLTRPIRQQLVRNTQQASRTLVRRQGPAAIRALPAVARSIQRTAVHQQMPVRALPSAIRNVTNRVAQAPTLSQRLSQSRPLAGPPVSTATPRVLTYTTRDVIDKRISVPAQHSLVRLSKNPATSGDAVGMLEEVKAGRLAGIYCVNWQIPAQRALRLGSNWWSVIPQGEDAVLMLDPENLSGGQPLITFRRELDPECGLLKGEKNFSPSPSRLDVALTYAWASYGRLRAGKIRPCTPGDKARFELARRTATFEAENPVSNVIPQCCPVASTPVAAHRTIMQAYEEFRRSLNNERLMRHGQWHWSNLIEQAINEYGEHPKGLFGNGKAIYEELWGRYEASHGTYPYTPTDIKELLGRRLTNANRQRVQKYEDSQCFEVSNRVARILTRNGFAGPRCQTAIRGLTVGCASLFQKSIDYNTKDWPENDRAKHQVIVYRQLGSIIGRLCDALDHGFVFRFGVLSGMRFDHTDPSSCDPDCLRCCKMCPEHWLVIFGYDIEYNVTDLSVAILRFVFWDPATGDSQSIWLGPHRGFGYLYYDSSNNRLTTAKNENDLRVGNRGQHLNITQWQKRYQTLTLQPVPLSGRQCK